MSYCQTCKCESDSSNCVCPDTVQSGELVVMDDNCRPRRLMGTGVAYADDNEAVLTDGSEDQGLIKLNPPTTQSASGIIVTDKAGTVLRIDEFTEGDILTIEGSNVLLASCAERNTI